MTKDNPWDELGDSADKKKSSTDKKKKFVSDFFSSKKNFDCDDNYIDSEDIEDDVDNENDADSSKIEEDYKHINTRSCKDSKSGKTSGFKCSDDENDTCECDFINCVNNFLKKTPLSFRIKKNFQLFVGVVSIITVLWLISGFYTVKQEESAIIMRFGKYVREENAGLHYHLPFPIEEAVKEATRRVRVIKIGGDESDIKNKEISEGLALTGDENIVNLELNVQWRIDDLKKFVFNVRDKQQTIYDATQSAIREVVSKRKLATILTSGRSEIEEEAKQLLQQMLNSYNMGVTVLLVQMLKIDPPSQVIDSFRDVQTARVDKESEINKAYKYKNDILPKVRGEAGKIIEDAHGYATSIVNRAKGDVSRFNQVYAQYKNAPFITRKRMYLDVMEELFNENKITIVDESVKNIFLSNKNDNKDEGDKQKEKVVSNSAVIENNE